MTESIKLCVLTTSFPVAQQSSAGHFVEKECQDLVVKNCEVSVIAPDHPAIMYAEDNSFSLHRFQYFYPRASQKVAYGSGIPENLKKSWLAVMQLPFFFFTFYRMLRNYGKSADILHCHWFLAGIVGVLGKRKGQKVVLTMHHVHRSNFIFRYVLRRTDFLFCNSNYTLNATNSIHKVGKSAVLKMGVDLELFSAKSEYKNHLFRILFVGRLITLKGVYVLINAFNTFLSDSEGKNALLTIVGDGPEKEHLQVLTNQLGLEQSIQFTGNKSRNELPDLYRSANVLVVPSLMMKGGETEGLGLVAMEAAACGIPVIGSRTGGIEEVVQDEQTGFLVDPNDADGIVKCLKRLADELALERRLGKEARNYAEHNFNASQTASQLLTAYNALLT